MTQSKVKIHLSNTKFDNDSITISRPVIVQGGTYFTKIRSSKNNTPYYVQFDACKTKQGVVTTNKRSYVDLLYNNEDVEILEWFENLQDTLISKVFEHKNDWFHNDMERTDIENNFVNITKSFKGGKYQLIRVGMSMLGSQNNKSKTTSACVVFDEYENVISLDDIQESDCIEGILEVQGIRFTSKSFQIEMVCKQVKVCQKESTFDKCMIVHDSPSSSSNVKVSHSGESGGDNNKLSNEEGIRLDYENELERFDDTRESEKNEEIRGNISFENKNKVHHVPSSIVSYNTIEEDTIGNNLVLNRSEEENKEVDVGLYDKAERFSENGKVEARAIDNNQNDSSANNREEKEEEMKNEENDIIEHAKENNVILMSDSEGVIDSSNHDILEPVGERAKHESDEKLNVKNTDDLPFRDTNEDRSIELIRTPQDGGSLEQNIPVPKIYESNNLLDVSSSFDNSTTESGTVTSLKDPHEIYYEIYKLAKSKAREHKLKSITHYLEARNIKNHYLLDDLDESDPDDDINDYYYDSDVTNQSNDTDQQPSMGSNY